MQNDLFKTEEKEKNGMQKELILATCKNRREKKLPPSKQTRDRTKENERESFNSHCEMKMSNGCYIVTGKNNLFIPFSATKFNACRAFVWKKKMISSFVFVSHSIPLAKFLWHICDYAHNWTVKIYRRWKANQQWEGRKKNNPHTKHMKYGSFFSIHVHISNLN